MGDPALFRACAVCCFRPCGHVVRAAGPVEGRGRMKDHCRAAHQAQIGRIAAWLRPTERTTP